MSPLFFPDSCRWKKAIFRHVSFLPLLFLSSLRLHRSGGELPTSSSRGRSNHLPLQGEEMDKRIGVRRKLAKPRSSKGLAKAVADYLASDCYMYAHLVDAPPSDSSPASAAGPHSSAGPPSSFLWICLSTLEPLFRSIILYVAFAHTVVLIKKKW